MPLPKKAARKPRWFFIPVRVALVTFILTLLSFALGLLLGIIGTALTAGIRGLHPNMTHAYRHVAIPVALTVAVVTAISMTVIEVRHYRQAKALAGIEQAG
jgi:uncharacterized BrkB/YihY/UPF0761 family membrane protein